MKKLYTLLMAVLLVATTNVIAAETWDPTKNTIEIVVPYAPGGGTDRTARVINEIFSQRGWKSIVVNKPGNNSIIGANYVASSKPNGYTLFMGGDGTNDANLAFRHKLDGINYDENSFVPIVPLGHHGLILVTSANSPVKTYDEFRTYVRRNPNKFNVGFWNTYEANAFLLWAKVDGLPSPEIINYKGAGPARVDLLAGNLDFAFDSVPSSAQYYQSDKIRILAALSSDAIKEIKSLNPKANVVDLTIKYPELTTRQWRGLYAPAGTDPAIVKEVNQVVNQGLQTKDIRDRIAPMDLLGMGGTPEQLQKIQIESLNRYRHVAKMID